MKIKQALFTRQKYAIMLRPAALAGSLILALSSIQPAHAHYNDGYENCTLNGSGIIYKDVQGAFKSTSSHLEFLTDWLDINHSPAWECTHYQKHRKKASPIGIKTWVSNLQLAARFEHGGEIYTIYKAGTSDHVGYIMRQMPIIPGSQRHSPDAVRALNTSNTNNDTLHEFWFLSNDVIPYTVFIKNQVRLVRWDPDHNFPDVNFTVPNFEVAKFSFWSEIYSGEKDRRDWPNPEVVETRPRRSSWISATLKRTDNTCSTPSSPTVHLPDIHKSAFADLNSTAGTTHFTLELVNCSRNINSIQYKLESSHKNPSEDDQNGILTLNPTKKTTAATGVKVQVRDGNGGPISFPDTLYTVPSYGKGTLTASIPLQVRYIKTHPTITAGEVHANMKVTYTYQ